MRQILLTVALLLGIALSAPAYAQFGPMDIVPVPPAPPQLWTVVKEDSNDGAPAAEANRPSALNAARVSLTYRPSKSRTRTNLQSFVDGSRSTDPAGAAQLEQLFASTDIITEIGAVMAQSGLDKNNAADAFALYWINAWSAAHGDNSAPSAATIRAVAKQAAIGLSASPQFAEASDAKKQEMSEALLVQAVLFDAAMQQAASKPSEMKALRKVVTEIAAASGLELDNIILTEEGFREGRPKKRADASDASGPIETSTAGHGSDEQGLSTSELTMIAAAGGAGLAGVLLLGKAFTRKV